MDDRCIANPVARLGNRSGQCRRHPTFHRAEAARAQSKAVDDVEQPRRVALAEEEAVCEQRRQGVQLRANRALVHPGRQRAERHVAATGVAPILCDRYPRDGDLADLVPQPHGIRAGQW